MRSTVATRVIAEPAKVQTIGYGVFPAPGLVLAVMELRCGGYPAPLTDTL